MPTPVEQQVPVSNIHERIRSSAEWQAAVVDVQQGMDRMISTLYPAGTSTLIDTGSDGYQRVFGFLQAIVNRVAETHIPQIIRKQQTAGVDEKQIIEAAILETRNVIKTHLSKVYETASSHGTNLTVTAGGRTHPLNELELHVFAEHQMRLTLANRLYPNNQEVRDSLGVLMQTKAARISPTRMQLLKNSFEERRQAEFSNLTKLEQEVLSHFLNRQVPATFLRDLLLKVTGYLDAPAERINSGVVSILRTVEEQISVDLTFGSPRPELQQYGGNDELLQALNSLSKQMQIILQRNDAIGTEQMEDEAFHNWKNYVLSRSREGLPIPTYIQWRISQNFYGWSEQALLDASVEINTAIQMLTALNDKTPADGIDYTLRQQFIEKLTRPLAAVLATVDSRRQASSSQQQPQRQGGGRQRESMDSSAPNPPQAPPPLQPPSTESATSPETPRPTNFFAATRHFVEVAQGSITGTAIAPIGTGANTAAWHADLQQASAWYSDARKQVEADVAAGKISREKADQMLSLGTDAIQLWDYRFKTMDGNTGGVMHVTGPEVDNWINPKRMRDLAAYYGFLKTETRQQNGREREAYVKRGSVYFEMRRLAILLITGIVVYEDDMGPIKDRVINHLNTNRELKKKYSYPDKFIENGGGIFSDLLKLLALQMDYKDIYEHIRKNPAPFRQTPLEARKDELDVMLMQAWGHNLCTGSLLDECYSIKARTGSSPGHVLFKLPGDKEGANAFALSIRPLSEALYLANNSPGTDKHTIMNLSLYSKDAIEGALNEMSVPHPPHVVEENLEEQEAYIDVFTDVHDVARKVNTYEEFPFPLEGILLYGVGTLKRYFDTDAAGWAWMKQTVWEDVKPLGHTDVALGVMEWIKMGIGRAKLIRDGMDMDTIVDYTKIRFMNLFQKYKGNRPRYKLTRIVSDMMLDGIIYKDVDDLRREIAVKVSTATTLKFLSDEDPALAAEIKVEILKLLGVVAVPKVPADTGEVEIIKYGRIPKYLKAEMRFEKAEKYLRVIWEGLKKSGFLAKTEFKWSVFKSRLDPDGYISHVHRPYLVREELTDKKH